MLQSWRWQIILIEVILIVLLAATAAVFAWPDVLPLSVLRILPSWLPPKQHDSFNRPGGLSILLQMDAGELQQTWLDALRDEARRELRGKHDEPGKQGILGFSGLGVEDGAVRFTLRDPADMEKALARLKTITLASKGPPFSAWEGADFSVEADGALAVRLKPTAAALDRKLSEALEAAMAIFRRRLDSAGVAESVVQRQGDDRVLAQASGVDDPEALKRLLGATARLTFQLVDASMTAEEAQRTRPPQGSALYASADLRRSEPLLLKKDSFISGEDLADARGGVDMFSKDEPVVSFRLSALGARRMAEVTEANVGGQLAIMIDGKVISAPVIREPIRSGRGLLSGVFTMQSANELAIQLRSGALPASFIIIEERYRY